MNDKKLKPSLPTCDGFVGWFYYLKYHNGQGLYDHISPDIINGYFVVAIKYQNLFYGAFATARDCYEYMKSLDKSQRCMFELITKNKPVKPYFDIDIDISDYKNHDDVKILSFDDFANTIKSQAIDSMLKVFIENFKINLSVGNDIIAYYSHGDNKRSFHVVINNYMCENTSEARSIYDMVIKYVDEKYRSFIDHSVYKKVQQFRLLLNMKFGTSRVKKTESPLIYNDQQIAINTSNALASLLRSIVTNVTLCQKICFTEEDRKEYTKSFSADIAGGLITDDVIEASIEMLCNLYECDREFLPLEFNCVQDNFIIFRRVHASICYKCNKIHDNENSFISVFSTIDEQRLILWLNCRRSEDRRGIRLGIISRSDNIKQTAVSTNHDDTVVDEVVAQQNDKSNSVDPKIVADHFSVIEYEEETAKESTNVVNSCGKHRRSKNLKKRSDNYRKKMAFQHRQPLEDTQSASKIHQFLIAKCDNCQGKISFNKYIKLKQFNEIRRDIDDNIFYIAENMDVFSIPSSEIKRQRSIIEWAKLFVYHSA